MSLLVNFDCEAKKKEKGKKKKPEIPDNRLRRDVNLATRGRRECEKRETEPSETKGGVEGEEVVNECLSVAAQGQMSGDCDSSRARTAKWPA